MIAEENLLGQNAHSRPEISVNKDTFIYSIINSFKQSVPFFKSYISLHVSKSTLNEDELTQIFVEQLDIQLRKLNYPFGVKNQYRDIYYGSSGFSDFYFHPIEEGKSTASIFSIESKRLPAPTNDREKEYVIGNNKNGGIERYKIEKHGKGHTECGMLGFIEKENSGFWKTQINKWIENLSKSDAAWSRDEILKEIENEKEYMYLSSIAHRYKSNDIFLHHFWIN